MLNLLSLPHNTDSGVKLISFSSKRMLFLVKVKCSKSGGRARLYQSCTYPLILFYTLCQLMHFDYDHMVLSFRELFKTFALLQT